MSDMTSVESIKKRPVFTTETYKILQETPTKHSISRNRTFGASFSRKKENC